MTDDSVSRPLKGRTAIVTGSGRNVGRAIALRFAQAGANVVLNGHSDAQALQHVAAEVRKHGVGCLEVLADVSDASQVQHMADEAIKQFGKIDIAVSNVASRRHQPLLEISLEDWHAVIDTNLGGAFYMARAVLPSMQANGWGRIIHMSATNGFMPNPNNAHNVAAKAGLHGLTKAIALEFGPFGITANTICLGKMDTVRDEAAYPGYKEQWAKAATTLPLRRLGMPSDAANACLYLASADSYLTGQAIHLNGGALMF